MSRVRASFWKGGLVVAFGSALVAAQEARPPFDPKRPPERELEMTTLGSFTLAAVGDCIISHPLTPLLAGDRDFAFVVDILRAADATFGNFENSAIDFRRFEGFPHRTPGDWALVASPAVAEDLKRMGFDLFSRANNHAMDWGSEGCARRAATWTKRPRSCRCRREPGPGESSPLSRDRAWPDRDRLDVLELPSGSGRTSSLLSGAWPAGAESGPHHAHHRRSPGYL